MKRTLWLWCANSDAGANAYTSEAIDQAYCAVQELPHS